MTHARTPGAPRTDALEYVAARPCDAAEATPHCRSDVQGEATERRRNTFLRERWAMTGRM